MIGAWPVLSCAGLSKRGSRLAPRAPSAIVPHMNYLAAIVGGLIFVIIVKVFFSRQDGS